MIDPLAMIHVCGGIPVVMENTKGVKQFWLNEEGIKIIEEIGPDKFFEISGETALKFLVD
jgi:hypothetical protein